MLDAIRSPMPYIVCMVFLILLPLLYSANSCIAICDIWQIFIIISHCKKIVRTLFVSICKKMLKLLCILAFTLHTCFIDLNLQQTNLHTLKKNQVFVSSFVSILCIECSNKMLNGRIERKILLYDLSVLSHEMNAKRHKIKLWFCLLPCGLFFCIACMRTAQ